MATIVLHKDCPTRTTSLSPSQPHKHKFGVGARVCYSKKTERLDRKTRKKNLCYQLSYVEILSCGYDNARNPRYECRVIDRLSIANGKIKKKSDTGRGTHPTAYDVERNLFSYSEWDEMIQRKINLTKVNSNGTI